MAFALIVDTEASSDNLNDVTTPAVDTSGANLIVVAVSYYDTAGTLTDSASNVWTALSVRGNANAERVRLYYCLNPTTSATHTFTFTDTGAGPCLMMQAWSGAGAFDAESAGGTGVGGTTIQPGSVTPAQPNSLFIVATHQYFGPSSADGSFTESAELALIADISNGGAMYYKVSSTAENPTVTSDNLFAAAMAVFSPGQTAKAYGFPLGIRIGQRLGLGPR